MPDFLEDLDVGDEGMQWLEVMGGDIDEESEGVEDYEEVGEGFGGAEDAEDDE